jgi:pimeloyl-ACP methyl ester carboxylesterase
MRWVLAAAISIAQLTGFIAAAPGAAPAEPAAQCQGAMSVCIPSLADIGIDALRRRGYSSSPRLLEQLGGPNRVTDYERHYSADGGPVHASFVAGYLSDGLSVYARIDVPGTAMPPAGYPVVLFTHGWIGRDAAPGYDFSHNTDSFYGELIDRYVDRGFLVVAPAYRGHGSALGRPADGIEWMEAWDTGSHLAPVFYAVDTLNLLEGLAALDGADWGSWGFRPAQAPKLDLRRVYLVGHSQGGDVALTVLAAAGEGSPVKQPIQAASIIAGNIADRFTQADTFGPLGSSLEAYLSGDGSWTGSAIGRDGSINPNFIFPWPQDWIGMTHADNSRWDWDAMNLPAQSVRQALEQHYASMYRTLNNYVVDIEGAEFVLRENEDGHVEVVHPERIRAAMLAIGGYHATRFLSEPLALHYADKDYYSLPDWNEDLARRIAARGGSAWAFRYPNNNHALKASANTWFSPPGTPDGLPLAVARDAALFSGRPPDRVEVAQ